MRATLTSQKFFLLSLQGENFSIRYRGSTMAMSASLLSILACPEDKGALYYIDDENLLYNPRLQRAYPVRDDIPVMLIDESTSVSASDHERIMDKVATKKIAPTF
jgi:uncharacterized protein